MENLERLKKKFSDATEIKLALKNASYCIVRSLIPKSATILDLHISKNYVTLIWSEEANKIGYPDATIEKHVFLDGKASAYITGDDVSILTSFHPFKDKRLINALEACPFFELNQIKTIDLQLGVLYGKINLKAKEYPVSELLNFISLYINKV